MSLILRKKCQVLLDDANLSIYHADMDTHKQLVIVGECGQPFIVVKGVTFNRTVLSEAEIDYAVELFSDFLATHMKKIKDYITAATIFTKKKEVPDEKPKSKIQFYGNYNSNTIIYKSTYKDELFHYRFNEKGRITDQSFVKEPISAIKLDAYTFDAKAFADAKQHLKDYITWREEGKKMEELKQALSSCSI